MSDLFSNFNTQSVKSCNKDRFLLHNLSAQKNLILIIPPDLACPPCPALRPREADQFLGLKLRGCIYKAFVVRTQHSNWSRAYCEVVPILSENKGPYAHTPNADEQFPALALSPRGGTHQGPVHTPTASRPAPEPFEWVQARSGDRQDRGRPCIRKNTLTGVPHS